eukprot:SAG31_NODE_3758_length_3911_cov_5.814533_2_plen_66_part_00
MQYSLVEKTSRWSISAPQKLFSVPRIVVYNIVDCGTCPVQFGRGGTYRYQIQHRLDTKFSMLQRF